MCRACLEQAKLFLTDPERAFDSVRKKEMSDSFVYMALLLPITSVLLAIMFFHVSPILAIAILVLSYVGSIVSTAVMGFWVHLWAWIFGAKKGVEETMKAVFYGMTPRHVFGWVVAIPLALVLPPITFPLTQLTQSPQFFTGVLASVAIQAVLGLWTLYLLWHGLRKLQNMPNDKATGAIVMAVIVVPLLIILALLLLLGLFAFWLIATMFATAGSGGFPRPAP